MIKLRVTLESKEDVIRELIIDEKLNLENLHKSIIQNFQLNEFEMASFYQTDSNLNLGIVKPSSCFSKITLTLSPIDISTILSVNIFEIILAPSSSSIEATI